MKASGQAVFLHSAKLDAYRYPEDCPFTTTRAHLAHSIAASLDLLSSANVREVAPEPAARETLAQFHTEEYLEALSAAAKGHHDIKYLHMGLGTDDCPIFPDMYDYAALACGATLTAADLIIEGRTESAFNPSGGFHHAGSATASGFCYLNDIALACLRLSRAGLRVMAIDLDVHHGEGVQAAFYERRDVLYLSFHETGKHLFPGTGFENEIGTGDGTGYTVNVPLPIGTYDEAYLFAFSEIAVPLLHAYSPDAIVVELGMDALAGDPLADLELTNNAHAAMVEKLVDAGKPVLATGGGGYHIRNTARGWALMWQILSGGDAVDPAVLGVGGVLLENTEWSGGLRDRQRAPTAQQEQIIKPQVAATVATIKRTVFPYHGL